MRKQVDLVGDQLGGVSLLARQEQQKEAAWESRMKAPSVTVEMGHELEREARSTGSAVNIF